MSVARPICPDLQANGDVGVGQSTVQRKRELKYRVHVKVIIVTTDSVTRDG